VLRSRRGFSLVLREGLEVLSMLSDILKKAAGIDWKRCYAKEEASKMVAGSELWEQRREEGGVLGDGGFLLRGPCGFFLQLERPNRCQNCKDRMAGGLLGEMLCAAGMAGIQLRG